MNDQPIGILDSGVGGLSVWQEIVHELPYESTVYIADSKHVPYGNRSQEEIFELSKQLVQFLLDKKAKLIVIACNTITVTNLDHLRLEFPGVPLIGIVPVVKTAAKTTKNKKIGILSTHNTAKSVYQNNLIEKFAHGFTVVNIGSDELVPFVEQGITDGEELEVIIKKIIAPFVEEEIDTLALGCSHFPFLKKILKRQLGSQVALLDSAGAVTRHVSRVLDANAIRSREGASHRMYTTAEASIFEEVLSKLLFDTMLSKISRVEKVYV